MDSTNTPRPASAEPTPADHDATHEWGVECAWPLPGEAGLAASGLQVAPWAALAG